MIIFALATGGASSISKLFLAGVVPGVQMCCCLAIAAQVVAVKRGDQVEQFPGWIVLFIAWVGSIPGLLKAAIILGGVLSGAFGAMYAFIATLVVYRSLTWGGAFKTAMASSAHTTPMEMILIARAGAFASIPLLDVPGENFSCLGSPGAGHVTKLINNFMGMTTLRNRSQAFAVAQRAGVDGQQLFDIMSTGPSSSPFMQVCNNHAVDGVSALGSSIANASRDIGYFVERC